MSKKTLILGLGNDILSDDRIGSQLVRDLSGIIKNNDIHFEITASGGLEIVDYLSEYEKVIIIDAIRTKNGIPGDTYCFRPSELPDTRYLPSFHDIDFITALKLGKVLFPDLTNDIHIIAVEVFEEMEFSDEFTQPVRVRYEEILMNVTRLVRGITGLNADKA